MPTLLQLLRLLDRADVTEVALQAGRAAFAKVGGAYQPVSRVALGLDDICALFDGTPLWEAPRHDGRTEQALLLDGKHYQATIVRAAEKLQVRLTALGRAPAAVPTTPAAGAAPPAAVAPTPVASKPRTAERPRTSRIVARLPGLAGAPVADAGLAEIVARARARGASDVHLIAGRRTCLRLFGRLQPEGEALGAAQVEAMLVGVMNGAQRERFEDVGYADFSLDLPQAGRTRVNVSRQATGLKGCFRLVPATIPSLASLGLPAELERVTHYHQGLAIIAGPSGHGKTTTLAALVDLVNGQRADHIITVEDPVEVLHPRRKALVSQREVGLHSRTFATALKAALRQDPDVIVIGELRDTETVEVALTAAETGHLVLATMNTRTAASTISRLISMFPPERQEQVRVTLAAALMIVMSQRLLPSPKGDALVPAVELITGGVQLSALIREDKLLQLPNLMARGRSAGMIQLDASLKELADAGRISKEVAMQFAENPGQLGPLLGMA